MQSQVGEAEKSREDRESKASLGVCCCGVDGCLSTWSGPLNVDAWRGGQASTISRRNVAVPNLGRGP